MTREELIQRTELGHEAKIILESALFAEIVSVPLGVVKSELSSLPAHDSAKFPALAVRRDTLSEIVMCLRGYVEQGNDASLVLSGEAPEGPTGRII